MATKKRALISVSDKRFLSKLGRDLIKAGYEIVASVGTGAKLKESNIPCKDLGRVFKASEMLGGRVKSLHAMISVAVLANRDDPAHIKDLKANKITPFDIVVVNFYPFSQKVKPGKTSLEDAVELIDIGGPTLVRAAAKNWKHVAVVCDISQYKELSAELRNPGGPTSKFRLKLARDAFLKCQEYDKGIAAYFQRVSPVTDETDEVDAAQALGELLPRQIDLGFKRMEMLRYGENPHQVAARYNVKGLPTMPYQVQQGKRMSYNNYLDAAAAIQVVSANYAEPLVACVVKHLNPCGIAIGSDPVGTLVKAKEADPKSAFGGIVGLNYPVDRALAKEIKRTFFEIVIAPRFSPEALEVLSAKKNLRLIEAKPEDCRTITASSPKLNMTVFGAMFQEYDTFQEKWENLQVVSNLSPDEALQEDILLGLTIIRFLKSNSICIVKKNVMVGVGLGQMSRVDAVEIAIKAAGRNAKDSVLISDGFFPFADSIELAKKAGLGCVVAPGGSKRDVEVVTVANKLKIPLVFTPHRHFLH